MIAVIMAGGKGTRIASVASDIPKPMIPIDGRPVLEHQLEILRRQGIREFIISVSHQREIIQDYFGTGELLGVHIQWFVEEVPLGNVGALFQLRDCLKEDFLLINGDIVFDIDIQRMECFHKERDALVTIFTHPNSHPYDSGLIVADEADHVIKWITKEDQRPKYYKNRVNAGIHIISPKLLDMTRERIVSSYDKMPEKIDLDRDVLKPLSGNEKFYCYDSPEYVKDMGTPERYESVCRDVITGRVHRKNLLRAQKAIFLDRDGTLNRYVGFLRTVDEFELLPGVSDAIKIINDAGYLAIVITNQPVIARGEVSEAELRVIHNKMETLLGIEGAYLDDIYYCPHHPDKGYPGERPELKKKCNCRKPMPGMILAAAEKYHIDLTSSWMIGDDKNDVLAGEKAGCKTALIGKDDYGQDITVDSLKQAIEKIIG